MAVHPLIQRTLDRAYRFGYGQLAKKNIHDIRAHYDRTFKATTLELPFQDLTVKPGVKVRVHYPIGVEDEPLPLVIFLRASGYVFGQFYHSDYLCELIARRTGFAVAAVEPRLAPEYKFPIPLEDCVASVKYLWANHENLNLDPDHTILWGESSGGAFAAVLSNILNSEKPHSIKQQILFYPQLDYYHDYPSKREFESGYLLDASLGHAFLGYYLNEMSESQNPFVSPLLADKFSHLPPTLLMGAQYDPLRDENAAYVAKLAQHNVPVTSLFMPGFVHGYLIFAAKIRQANYALNFAIKWVIPQSKERYLC